MTCSRPVKLPQGTTAQKGLPAAAKKASILPKALRQID
jgi:hypothetical protein